MKVGVLGARGKVGREVCAAVEAADDLELVAAVDTGDGDDRSRTWSPPAPRWSWTSPTPTW